MSSVILTPSQPQSSSSGPWSAYAGAWAASSLTYGVDYTQSITFDNTAFPNGTLISWSFPLYGGPFGVWSYPCIVFGSTPELTNAAVLSLQVANLTNLSVSYSTTLAVNSGQLDTIFDIWLTSKPYGGMSTATYELEIIPQTEWRYGGYAYTFSDLTLQNANVYVNANWGGNPWTNIVVEPSTEMLTGTINISDILKNLIWNGVITGQEYISGVEFGPEPGSGAGSLLISSMSYQWTGSSTVRLPTGNNIFQIGAPGGNDIVGNGAIDTVVYSAAFSRFQIKELGTEVLVIENGDISTLDYLDGVTFVQFSDGLYNTTNSTFTITTPEVIQTDTGAFGPTSLTSLGSNYLLLHAGTGNGVELTYGGMAVWQDEFGSWVPIGAVQTATGYDVAWKVADGSAYTVWATDANGNYVSNIVGPSPGTSYVIEISETIFHQDLNGDGVIGLNAQVVQTDTNTLGSTSLAAFGSNYLMLHAGTGNGVQLTYGGLAVWQGEFSSWTPIGAVQTTNGYAVAWRDASSGLFTVWATDANGNYLNNVILPSAGSNYAIETSETTFHQDLNGDGVTGLNAQVIQTDSSTFGSTSLAAVGSNFALLAAGTTTGPELTYGGMAVWQDEFGSWVPIGAVQTATGYDVAWKVADGSAYTVWATDANGNYVSNIVGPSPGTSYVIETSETIFHQDLNGDGVIGLNAQVVQTDTNTLGSTSLAAFGSNYLMLHAGTGNGVQLTYGGLAVWQGEFSSWTPIGAVQTTNGYDVAWRDASSGLFTVWATDANGNYLNNVILPSAGSNYAIETSETTFHQDLNGDGVTGLNAQVIQTDSSTFGSTSLAAVGSNFALLAAGTTTGPELTYGGMAVWQDEFGSWVPIGAVQTATGYDVAWKVADGSAYTVWATDAKGNYVSNIVGPSPGTSYVIETSETIFHQDLNGDGVVGLYAAPSTSTTFSSIVSGSSGAATIGANAVLEITAANSATVTFAASTGMLKIDQPSTFSGQILTFTGTGTLAGSDQIDLVGINYSTLQESYASGVLTVTDGTHAATLRFQGSYLAANFAFADDAHGGTLVLDPPVAKPSSVAAAEIESVATTQDATTSVWEKPVVTDPVDIAPGATFKLTSTFVAPVTFKGSNGKLQLDDSQAFSGTIAGFANTDQIDLRDIAFGSQMTLGYASNSNGAGGTLTVSDGSHRAA